MPDDTKISIVILAAGGSTRMGKAKQLLPVGDVPLLQKSVDAARALFSSDLAKPSKVSVYVVLGAQNEAIQKAVSFEQCQVLINENWQSGMSSSIVLALNQIEKDLPEAAAVVLMMGDQPWVKSDLLSKIIDKFAEGNCKVVVSSFAAKGSDEQIPGPPALFARELFPELKQLEGDVGARQVVLSHADSMAAIDFPLGAIDIDTETDYVSLLAAL